MNEPFEIAWLGGPSEAHFRKARPDVLDLPWGTLAPGDYPAALVEHARVSWTETAIAEYRAALSFSELLRAMLEAKAPLDLVGMAGQFVTDEAVHVELACRVAMELGGGAPRLVDFATLSARPSRELTPMQRANELVVRVSCVSEVFSREILAGTHEVAGHPLTRAVYATILRDEARHGMLGGLYLEWADALIDDVERTRLAGVALEALRGFAPLWRNKTSKVKRGITSEGYRVADVHALGWLDSERYVARARETVRRAIVAPLGEFGIALDGAEIEKILSEDGGAPAKAKARKTR